MKKLVFISAIIVSLYQTLTAQNFLTNRGVEVSGYVPTANLRSHGLRVGGSYEGIGVGLKYALVYEGSFKQIYNGFDIGYTFSVPKTVFKLNLVVGMDDVAYEGILNNGFMHAPQYNIGGNAYWTITQKGQSDNESFELLIYPMLGYTYSKSQSSTFNADKTLYFRDENKYSGRIGCLFGTSIKKVKFALLPYLNITGKESSIFHTVVVDGRVAYTF